jgi:hypothetical protein
MPALGCQPRSNGLRRAVTPGPSQRQDGPPSLLTRLSGCWASRGCGLAGRVPRSGTNPGSPELGRVGGQVPVPAHSCESVRVRGVHACAHKLHTFPTGRLSSTRKRPGQAGAPGRVRTCDPPLRRCRHRVRTSSPVSSEIPRPGVSPRFGHIGPGQTAHRTAHIIGPKAALATPSAVTSDPRLMERVRLSCGGDLGMAGEGVVERLRNRDVPWTRPHNSRGIGRIVPMSVRSSRKSGQRAWT